MWLVRSTLSGPERGDPAGGHVPLAWDPLPADPAGFASVDGGYHGKTIRLRDLRRIVAPTGQMAGATRRVGGSSPPGSQITSSSVRIGTT